MRYKPKNKNYQNFLKNIQLSSKHKQYLKSFAYFFPKPNCGLK